MIETIIAWDGDAVRYIDQRLLPHETRYERAQSVEEIEAAIRTLAVRGAPCIGVFGAYGVALLRQRIADDAEFRAQAQRVREARPTAVNLAWAVDRVLGADDALQEARAIHDEQIVIDEAIGRYGIELVPKNARVMTLCNTGPLATAASGTAAGVIIAAQRAGKKPHAFVCETRPLLQGARLNYLELQLAGVDSQLIVDSAAAIAMRRHDVDLVIVGADRIARNGDTANKIGTYSLAVLAAHHGIPFYIAAPRSTFDFSIASGERIPIEERHEEEVLGFAGTRVAPEGARAYNPAFDVTPGHLVTAFVTECGIVQATLRRDDSRSCNYGRTLKFYDFLDKQPAIGKVVVIEGTQRVLADRATDVLFDRLLPVESRDLNLSRFTAEDIGDMSSLREALQAMPFLADRRVVHVNETQTMRVAMRRELLLIAQSVPDGNTLVLVDLLAPRVKGPEPFGAALGRAALRIDTTADGATRERFIGETLERLGATAQPRAIAALADGNADLSAVRNDLEKLALVNKKITLGALEQESLSIPDPKAYKYAHAVLQGNASAALAIAYDMFEGNRGAGTALLSALAGACKNLWELARPGGGRLVGRDQWNERILRPLVPRYGVRGARAAYERAVHGIESIVTGKVGSTVEEHRTLRRAH